MNIVIRRRTPALALHSRSANRRPSPDDALAHVPCFGMELLERRILYAATYRMSDLLLEPDGSTIVVGETSNTLEIGLWRLNPDGTPDASFGTGGAAIADIYDDAVAAVRLADGKYLVVGTTELGHDGGPGRGLALCLYRFNADGTIDRTWGNDGKVAHNFGLDDAGGRDLSVRDDGTILVAGAGRGESYQPFSIFARFLPDGQLDASYGNGGVVTTALAAHDNVLAISFDEGDGSALLLAGHGAGDDDVLRFNPDGTLDTSFGDDGRAPVPLHLNEGEDGYARDLARLADGGYVVTGTVYVPDPTAPSSIVASRFHADGSVVTSFGDDGVKRIGNDVDRFGGTFVGVRSDGKIVLSGSRNPTSVSSGDHTSPLRDVVVAELFPDGSLDTSFGDNGIITTDLGKSDVAGQLRVAPDGTIVLAGVSDGRVNFVVRFASGAPVPAAPQPQPSPEPEPEPEPDSPTPDKGRPDAAIFAGLAARFLPFDGADDAAGSAFSLLTASSSDLLDGDADEDELLPAST